MLDLASMVRTIYYAEDNLTFCKCLFEAPNLFVRTIKLFIMSSSRSAFKIISFSHFGKINSSPCKVRQLGVVPTSKFVNETLRIASLLYSYN